MKVLIIGNDNLIQNQLKEILVKDQESIFIKQAYSYEDARKVFSTFLPDKVFLDLTLYEEGILRLLKMFKKLNPSVKVTFMVSSPADPFIKTCLKIGADDFLDKSNIKV